MAPISRAIVLAAGMGSRLKPLTNDRPKCLTDVNGTTILEQTLRCLARAEIEDVVIVVGHLGQVIVDTIGRRYAGLRVSYRWNESYGETNSMYSLWLARDYLSEGTVLVEGDVIFDDAFLDKALDRADGRSYWLLDRFGPESEGSMSITDADGRIVQLRIQREPLVEYPDNYFKSTGVLALNAGYGRNLSRWLTDEVDAGNVNVYYDLVIAKHLQDVPLYACHVGHARWAEIDTPEDLRKAERLFQAMKHCIIVMDGAADRPVRQLDGRTPLEAADMPAVNGLAARGRVELMQTIYEGLPAGSIVANMGILGYNPARYYPYGRASFEALGQDLFLEDRDLVFRCNLISIGADREITDFTSDQISNGQALTIINNLALETPDVELYAGQSYRNLLIVRGAGHLARHITSREPHTHIGVRTDDILLQAADPSAAPLVNQLNALMRDSVAQIRAVNDRYHTRADMLWLWSPSSTPRMPSFTARYGKRGAIIAGLDFMRGIGEAIGMDTREIAGATGYLDTDLKQKLRYAKNFLQHNDLVFIHVNAPDEEAHLHHVENKVRAIERIDHEIVQPLVAFLDERYPGNYRIAILPDHYTRLEDGHHGTEPVPYVVYGAGVAADGAVAFTEAEAAASGRMPLKSYEFMDAFLQPGEYRVEVPPFVHASAA